VSGEDIVGLVLETLTLLGFVVGFACLAVAIVIRLADGQWIETTAVVLRDADAPLVRWLTEEGSLYTRPLDDHESDHVGRADEASVFYSRRVPDRMRFTRRHDAERVFGLVFAIATGLGVVSLVASTVHLVVAA
jgi:hypothetical protein